MYRNPVRFYGSDPYFVSSVRDALVYAHGWGMAEATKAVTQRWGKHIRRWQQTKWTPPQAADEIVRLIALREDDRVQEIQSELEKVIEELADENGALSFSTLDDSTEECVARKGYDPTTIVVIASFGDAYAVNGDILVPPYWEKELELDPKPHPETWAAHGKGKFHAAAILEDWLDDHGYKQIRCGGRVPTAEECASGETAVEIVARQLGATEDEVADAAEALEWWDEEVCWSVSGDTYVWAKKAAGTDDE